MAPDAMPTAARTIRTIHLEQRMKGRGLNTTMTPDPLPLTANLPTDTIRIPYPLKRRTVQLYYDLLQALLAQLGHYVILDRIESDPTSHGWLIHLICHDQTTITLLHDAAAEECSRSDPLALLL
jgi:hypothetical protein